MKLGRFELCLKAANLDASVSFYLKLGFTQVGGNRSIGVIVLESGNCRIGLYEGHIAENLLNFRGGDIPALAERVRAEGLAFEKEPFAGPDGSMAALLRDPGGNAVYFVSHSDEAQ